MDILVTGSSGFIGTHICSDLVKMGHNVIGLDINRPKIHINKVKYVLGDVCDVKTLKKIHNKHNIKRIFHLASVVGVNKTDSNPLLTLDTNVLGIRTILTEFNDIEKIFYASTSEVYGEAVEKTIVENHPKAPKSVYGISKLVGEKYCEVLSKENNFNYVIARFFNVYGPFQRLEWVIPKFVIAALKKQPLTIFGNGKQIRSYVFVTDISTASIQLMFSKKTNNNEFNVGNPSTKITVNELANLIGRLTGYKEKKYMPLYVDRNPNREIYNRVPSIDKIKKTIHQKPKIDLLTGIKEVIKYWKMNG